MQVSTWMIRNSAIVPSNVALEPFAIIAETICHRQLRLPVAVGWAPGGSEV